MTQSSIQPLKELELIKQLVGEWAVGIAMKMPDDKVVAGCGTMTAKETVSGLAVSSEMNMHLEGYDEYLEVDLWSFDRPTGKVHLFSVNSAGEVHDHIGGWKDGKTLEVEWRGVYGGEKTAEDIWLTRLTKDELRVREVDSSEGKVNLTVDYILKRK
jgi:hypothetical protein